MPSENKNFVDMYVCVCVACVNVDIHVDVYIMYYISVQQHPETDHTFHQISTPTQKKYIDIEY